MLSKYALAERPLIFVYLMYYQDQEPSMNFVALSVKLKVAVIQFDITNVI